MADTNYAVNELRAREWRYADCELFQIGLDEIRKKREIAPLTARQARIALLLGQGYTPADAAKELRAPYYIVKHQLAKAYRRLGLNDPRLDPRVKLGLYASCELFQIGLQELGLVLA